MPNILIPVCVFLWERMLSVLSPSSLRVLCLSFVLRRDSKHTHTHSSRFEKENQTKWETLSVRSGLPRHTERHLVQAYCTDNQNASCNAIITQQHPRQLYYTHSKDT